MNKKTTINILNLLIVAVFIYLAVFIYQHKEELQGKTCVHTSDGVKKCFDNQTEAVSYAHKVMSNVSNERNLLNISLNIICLINKIDS